MLNLYSYVNLVNVLNIVKTDKLQKSFVQEGYRFGILLYSFDSSLDSSIYKNEEKL